MTTPTEMSEALIDVRKAYRLLYGYHRRVRDIVQLCAKILPEQPFKQRTIVNSLGSRSQPLGTWWTWDCTPTFDWMFLFADDRGAKSKTKSKLLFVINFIADDQLEDAMENRGEPDPSKLAPSERSNSVIDLYMIRSTLREPNWTKFFDAYYVDENEAKSDPVFRWSDNGQSTDYSAYWIRVPMESFVDEQSIVSIVKTFRENAVSAFSLQE